jgi:cathepsin B
MINKINSDPTATWKAGVNKVFEGKTLAEVRHMLGAFLIVPESDMRPRTTYKVDTTAIPTSFDSKTQWSNCAHPIRNQARCGSCWAFSAAEALTDRLCISTNGATNVVLSPQDMVSCDKSNYGCQGGYLDKTWQYLERTGIVSDACLPYTSGGGFVASCPSSCKGTGTWTKHKVKSGTTKHFGSVAAAQQDIMTYGPLQTGFTVYQDFFNYVSGVYTHKTGGMAGGHAVKVDGWGVDNNGTPYWIVANSWGASWGQSGYFWIKRGTNECNFESQMYAGQSA